MAGVHWSPHIDGAYPTSPSFSTTDQRGRRPALVPPTSTLTLAEADELVRARTGQSLLPPPDASLLRTMNIYGLPTPAPDDMAEMAFTSPSTDFIASPPSSSPLTFPPPLSSSSFSSSSSSSYSAKRKAAPMLSPDLPPSSYQQMHYQTQQNQHQQIHLRLSHPHKRRRDHHSALVAEQEQQQRQRQQMVQDVLLSSNPFEPDPLQHIHGTADSMFCAACMAAGS